MLEICCGSYADALAAYQGGAKRIELNSALFLGGLTPSIASLKLVKEHTDLEVVSMVRPRGAGFYYSELEYQQMKSELMALLSAGSDGIAFGFLNPDQTIDLDRTKEFITIIHQANKTAVFHRAIDCTPDIFTAVQQLIDLGVDRVLTSGTKANAWEGKEVIKELVTRFKTKIQILPGSGINMHNALDLINYTGVSQIHSSCKKYQIDPTTHSVNVSFAYNKDNFEIVDQETVAALIQKIKDI